MTYKGTWTDLGSGPMNLMRLIVAKCQVLHLGSSIPVGGELENIPEEKEQRVLIDKKASHEPTDRACTHKANCILDCIRIGMDNYMREGNVPICSALARPHLEVLYPGLRYLAQESCEAVRADLEEGWSTLERLKKLSLFIQGKRKLQEDFIIAFQGRLTFYTI